jgi:hypothetical protein
MAWHGMAWHGMADSQHRSEQSIHAAARPRHTDTLMDGSSVPPMMFDPRTRTLGGKGPGCNAALASISAMLNSVTMILLGRRVATLARMLGLSLPLMLPGATRKHDGSEVCSYKVCMFGRHMDLADELQVACQTQRGAFFIVVRDH